MRVHSVEELVDLMLMLAGNQGKVASGPGVGVITFGGGNGVLGADQCAQNGLATPALSRRMRRAAAAAPRFGGDAPPIRSISRRPRRFAPKPWRSFRRRSTSSPRSREIQSLLFIVGSMAAKAAEISDVICGLAERARQAGLRELALAAARACRRGWPSAASTRSSSRRAASARSSKLVEHGAAMQPAGAAGDDGTSTGVRLVARSFPSSDTARGRSGTHDAIAFSRPPGLRWPPANSSTDEAACRARRPHAIGLPVVLKGISAASHASRQGRSGRGRSALGGRGARGISSACARARPSSRRRSTASTCRRCTRAAPSCSSPPFAIRCSA